MSLVAQGLPTKEIAARAGVTERAVTARLSRLFRAYGVPNRAGLIAAAMSQAGVGLTAAMRPESPGGALPDIARGLDAYTDAPFMVSVTLGPEHRYVFVNAIAAHVAARTDLVGKTVAEAYPDLDPAFRAALDRVYEAGEPWAMANAPARFSRPDGTFRDTRMNLMFQPLFDRDGRTAGILHIGTEIAETPSH